MSDSVVITGVGIVSPLGVGANESAQAWRDERPVGRRTLPELLGTPLEGTEVASLPQFDLEAAVGGRRNLRYMAPAAALAYIAASEAMNDAEARGRISSEEIGLYATTGAASADYNEIAPVVQRSIDDDGRFSCVRFGAQGLPDVNPLLSFRLLGNMPACLIAILEGIRGPSLVLTPWEDQTCAALAEAWQDVASGACGGILTGAASWVECPVAVATLRKTGRIDTTSFLASAAAFVFLEREDSALDGRHVYARITNMSLSGSTGARVDPLAHRIGRTGTAAPAALLALAAVLGWREMVFDDGIDTRVTVELEPST